MPDSTVNIKLVTSADTSGADKTAAAVRKVEQATRAASATERQRADSLEKAAGSLNALHGAQTRAGGSNRNLGNALLQTSRGIQDMQYGLAGAVNNLEGIATALGLGAGVAGVVTVLAVAVQQLGPKVIDMLKSFDGAAQVKASIMALQEQLGKTEPVDAAAKAAERYRAEITAGEKAVKDENSAIDAQIKLLTLQAASKRSAAEFALEQGIQDVQAQGLPKDQEAAIIAERRIQFAEQQRAAEDELAISRLNAAAEQRSNAEQAAQDAAAELADINAKIERTQQYNTLLEQEKGLRDELTSATTAAENAARRGTPSDEAEMRRRELSGQLENNQAAQAAVVAQGVGNLPSLVGLQGIAQGRAQGAGDAANAARRAAADAADQERLQAEERAAELERERQRIGRGLRPGVFDAANLQQPAPLFGPAPLPTARPGVALPVGGAPASLPGYAQPLPQLDTAAKATQQAALSGDQSAESVIRFAETTTSEMERLRKANEAMQRKLTTLETQMKNQR
jgi:hypothetical protein